jgi:photosystem II stability/assembly factor-like uncharacterized protein
MTGQAVRTTMTKLGAIVGIALIMMVSASGAASAGVNRWTSHGPVGGIVYALAIDPTAPSTLYAATYGGIYKTVDGGASWRPVNTGLVTDRRRFTVLAIDPVTPTTLYAAVAFEGPLFKTVDGGAHWTLASTGLPAWNVTALAIDPATPATLYAGLEGGGVYKSLDGGGSWAEMNTGLTDREVTSLVVDWRYPFVISAGTRSGGVFQSFTAGAKWQAYTTGMTSLFVTALAIDPTFHARMYAGTLDGVNKSEDGGGMYFPVNAGMPPAGYRVVRSLAIDPVTPAIVYAGMSGGFFSVGAIGGVFKTLDGGGSWTKTSVGLPVAATVHALAVDPATPATLYAGTDGGGVYKSVDGGAHWTPANAGLTVPLLNAVAVDPAAPATLYAATADGVFKSGDAGLTWTDSNAGLDIRDVRSLAIDPQAHTTVYAATYSGGVYKSTNAGASWAAASTGMDNLFALTIAIDPANPATLYVSTEGRILYGGPGADVYRSDNGGATWVPASAGIATDVYAFAIDPATPGTVYAGSWNRAYKTVNAGDSWNWVPNGLPFDSVVALAIDPATPATVYAATAGNRVFKSVNAGGEWIQIENGLTSDYVNALAIDPTAPATIYAGTDGGVYRSVDAGASWAALNPGLTASFVQALALNPATPTTLYAGVFAGGVFQIRQLPMPIVTGAGPGAGPDVRGFTAAGAPTATSFAAYPAGFAGGVFVAVADLEGGGGMHIVTGTDAGGGAQVRAFDADGTPRGTNFLVYPAGFLGGVRVAACDFDGDGKAEIVTGAGPTGAPHVRVIELDGTGQPAADLASFLAFDAGFVGGVFVACGDVDGDGHPEIVVGADAGGGPDVRIFTYTAGAPDPIALLHQFFAYDPGFQGGIRVAAADVDGSGRASIVLGAGPGGGPHVRVVKWTGAGLTELASFLVYAPEFDDGIYVAAGHVTGGAAAEVVTGAGAGGASHVRVFTGTGVDTGVGFFAYDPLFIGGVRVGAVN